MCCWIYVCPGTPRVHRRTHTHRHKPWDTHSYTQNHTDALTNSIKRFVCNTNIPDINRHRVQTLNISLHVMYAHLCRVHTRLRDTSTFTKKHNWICTNAPTEQNDLPLFIQVCVWGSDQNFNPSPQTHREWLTAVVVFLSSSHSAIPQLSFFSLTSALLSLSSEETSLSYAQQLQRGSHWKSTS